MSLPVVLVTGATGVQGRSTIKSLLQLKANIRAFVRSHDSDRARALEKSGVELAVGNFDDYESLVKAMSGASAVFMNVSPSSTDTSAETRHADNIIAAATQPGNTVQTLVYTTTILTGQHDTFPGWATWNDFARRYWIDKAANEESVRQSGIPNWTILRPPHFMSNYLKPLAPFFFPELLSQGILRTALKPDTRTLLIDPDDLGRFVARALTEPERFRGSSIDIGSEALTPPQIVAALSKVSGREIKAEYLSDVEIKELIPKSHVISAQTFFNERSSKLDVESMRDQWGMHPITFLEFLESRKEDVLSSFQA
ncbi:NAD dependent epimerase/dehydratase [Xylaria arbuscula]|nr:NAD dependent epimerase/dehydratase [Xylaria arbuscula]